MIKMYRFSKIVSLGFICLIFLVMLGANKFNFDYNDRIQAYFVSLIFLYMSYVLYSSRLVLTDDSIENVIYFWPFYPKRRICKFSEIERISYDFLIFEEIGSFKIYPKSGNMDNMVVIHFMFNNKKEIIEKILEKRPDLKIEGWVNESVLNYKVVHKKFLLIAAAIILVSILILLLQR